MTNYEELARRVIVVTGSARGIGRGVCLAAGELGMRVVGIDINDDGGGETAQQVRQAGGESWYFHCDVSDPVEVSKVFATIEDTVGPTDVLVNNAALVIHTPPEGITGEQWQRVVGVNLTGMVFPAQSAGRSMIKAGRGGSIINMTSIAGLAALGRGNFSYSICKAGIIGLTRELAIEWAGFGIRVNAVAPSQVYTEGFRGLIGNRKIVGGDIMSDVLPGIPLGRLAEVSDIVSAVLFLASDSSAFITGVTLPVDGGSLALHAGGSLRAVGPMASTTHVAPTGTKEGKNS